MKESESIANWGGVYSTFYTHMEPDPSVASARRQIAQEMVKSDAVELELAATALFLASEKVADPWGETARRKPEKAASGRLDRARQLYQSLRQIPTPKALPQL